MNKKGQGALEYLLLIGGAILIAAVVLTVMTTIQQQAEQGTESGLKEALCAQKQTKVQCDAADVDNDTVADCEWVDLDADTISECHACADPQNCVR